MKLKLQTRYGLSILTIVVSVVFVLAGTLLFQFKGAISNLMGSTENVMAADLLTQYKHRGASLVEFLARDLVKPFYHYDIEELFKTLQVAKKQPGVRYAYVYDTMGRIVQDGDTIIPPQNKVIQDDFMKKALAIDGILIETGSGILDVAQPIAIGDQVLGGVRVGLELTTIRDDVKNMQVQMGLIHDKSFRDQLVAIVVLVLFLGVVGFVLAGWLARSLSRPILNLVKLAAQIGRGDYAVSSVEERSDEVGELAQAFQKMALNLKETTVSKSYVDNIIGQMIDTLVVVSMEGLIEKVNRSACELLGYSEAELLGQSFEKLVWDEAFKQAWLSRVKANGTLYGAEIDYLTKTKRRISVQFAGALMRDTEGNVQGIICVARDITQLKKQEKFAAIGQLAASVAHELRNPLGAIQNSIYYLKDTIGGSPVVKEDPNMEEFMEIATKEINRSNRIVSELLDYSREVKINPQPTDVSLLLTEAAASLDIPNSVNLSFEHDSTLPPVILDSGKIHQVATNLMSNAIQAMPQGGALTVKSQIETDRMRTQWLRLDFMDTGGGITEDNIKHIFEPLFTTKTKGTGLGLAICQEIVKAHAGKIDVQSEIDKGTRMIVRIPLVLSLVKAA